MKWTVITLIYCQIDTNTAVLTAQLYSNVVCSVLGIANQQDLSNDLECDPFLNTAMQRFTCDLYYCFGAFLAPVSVGIITSKHYGKKFWH